MTKSKCVYVFAIFLLLLLSNSVSFADLLLKITANDYELNIGEEATIQILGKSELAIGLNGLNVWQLDMFVNNGGIVEVKTADGSAATAEINLVAPTPIAVPGSGWQEVNADLSGNVLGLGVSTPGPYDSATGVGDYSLLAEVTIVGIAVGQTTYTLGDADTPPYSLGFYGMLKDATNEDGSFVQGNNVFTVVPEPTSLLIISGLAALALRKRKTE